LKGECGSADYAAMMERKPRRRNEARRLKIASGLVHGKSMAEIAREAGVSRQTIWKQAGSADVGQIIVAAVNGEIERLTRMFDRVLSVIEEAFEAQVIRAGRNGELINVGPDHYARLAAGEKFIKLLTAGRPVPKAPEYAKDDNTLTLADLEGHGASEVR